MYESVVCMHSFSSRIKCWCWQYVSYKCLEFVVRGKWNSEVVVVLSRYFAVSRRWIGHQTCCVHTVSDSIVVKGRRRSSGSLWHGWSVCLSSHWWYTDINCATIVPNMTYNVLSGTLSFYTTTTTEDWQYWMICRSDEFGLRHNACEGVWWPY